MDHGADGRRTSGQRSRSLVSAKQLIVDHGIVCLRATVQTLPSVRCLRLCWVPTLITPYLEPDSMPHFKTLGVGGEAVTKSHLGPWQASSTKVVEMYGPTECCVYSSVNMQLSPDDPSDIGRPVDRSQPSAPSAMEEAEHRRALLRQQPKRLWHRSVPNDKEAKPEPEDCSRPAPT